MANSDIDFQNGTIRVNDQRLTILVLLMSDIADQRHGFDAQVTEIVGSWKTEVLNAPPGLISPDLSPFSDRERTPLLMNLPAETEQHIHSFGGTIPGGKLMDFSRRRPDRIHRHEVRRNPAGPREMEMARRQDLRLRKPKRRAVGWVEPGEAHAECGKGGSQKLGCGV